MDENTNICAKAALDLLAPILNPHHPKYGDTNDTNHRMTMDYANILIAKSPEGQQAYNFLRNLNDKDIKALKESSLKSQFNEWQSYQPNISHLMENKIPREEKEKKTPKGYRDLEEEIPRTLQQMENGKLRANGHIYAFKQVFQCAGGIPVPERRQDNPPPATPAPPLPDGQIQAGYDGSNQNDVIGELESPPRPLASAPPAKGSTRRA